MLLMAELTPQERLQPALLDRLTDDQPQNRRPEPLEKRVMTKSKLRQAVLRDLESLLNATAPNSTASQVAYPHAARSVINFGLPPLAGATISTLDVVDLERMVKEAIKNFESRIDSETLEVEAIVAENFLDRHNIVTMQIRGNLWAQPVPMEILLRTDVDLESGEVTVLDVGRGG